MNREKTEEFSCICSLSRFSVCSRLTPSPKQLMYEFRGSRHPPYGCFTK